MNNARPAIIPLLKRSTGTTNTSRYTFDVSGENLYTNEELVHIQRYPGDVSPSILSERERFPRPDIVGTYISREDFQRVPKWPAQWVHWRNRAELVLQGRYNEVPPVHFEGIFTLVCNFMCPHCSRRPTRIQWVKGGTWENSSPVTEDNTINLDHLIQTIDRMAQFRIDDQMGIVWGGGDPTATPWVYEAMMHAKSKGIKASFLTNGVFMEPERLLEVEPVLVQVSLNCGTEDVYAKFHGYPKRWGYFGQVIEKIREMARLKVERHPRTLFGMSLIMDERNLDDTIAAAQLIASIVEEVGHGCIDYCIVRPVFNYSHFEHNYAKLNSDTKAKARAMVEEGGVIQTILDRVNVPLVMVKDSFDPPPAPELYDAGTDCLSYGWCGEIRHNGDVQLCSDSMVILNIPLEIYGRMIFLQFGRATVE